MSELKALLRYEFTTAVRSVTVMVSPSRGTVTVPGMAYLREHFHNPGGVATGHRGQPLTANRATDQTEVSS